MPLRSFATGQHILVPDPNDPDPDVMIPVTVIEGSPSVTKYRDANDREGWTYTTRCKINPLQVQP